MTSKNIASDALDVRVARNRRAIYTGLKPFFPEDELIAALSLWQTRYSDGPAYALHGFINDICTSEPLKQIRNDLHRSLRQALFGPDEALENDPLLQIERWNSARGKAGTAAQADNVIQNKPPLRPKTQVFELLFEHFLALIEEEGHIGLQIRGYIDSHLDRILSNGPVSVQVSGWLRGKQVHLDDCMELTEMRAILHMAYVLACEYVGPIETDKMLSAAVRYCESQDIARQFSPREFL